MQLIKPSLTPKEEDYCRDTIRTFLNDDELANEFLVKGKNIVFLHAMMMERIMTLENFVKNDGMSPGYQRIVKDAREITK